jgi:ABC-type multidrug transport system permease subunit
MICGSRNRGQPVVKERPADRFGIRLLRTAFCAAAYTSLVVSLIAFVCNQPLRAEPLWPKRVADVLVLFLGAMLLLAFAVAFLSREFDRSTQVKVAAIAAILALLLACVTTI